MSNEPFAANKDRATAGGMGASAGLNSAGFIQIHGRFAPNGTVVEIGERPANLTPQEWFNCLNEKAGDTYRTLAGGRIFFSIEPGRLDAIKAQVVAA
ncbi:MAG: hypothetical protein ACLQUZ_11815 [Rhizomicrobium sp.]